MLKLVSKEGEGILVKTEHAEQCSLLLRDMLDDDAKAEAAASPQGEGHEIPVPIASASSLKYVVDYMNLRYNNTPKEIPRPLTGSLFEHVDEKDATFIKEMKEDDVMQLMVVAGFLNMPTLRDLTAARVSEWVKEKNVEEVRTMFGISNDFTPEEEAKLRKEHFLDQ